MFNGYCNMEYSHVPDCAESEPQRCATRPLWAVACIFGLCASVIGSQLVKKPLWASVRTSSRPSLRTQLDSFESGPVDVVLEPGMLVRGTSSLENGRSFYNIPYAHAGRWEEPRLTRWNGTLNAESPSTYCMQPGYPQAVEHCLSLNVLMPPSTKQYTSVPVFVWLFGGGYLGGRAADFTLSGSKPAQHLVSHGLATVVPDFRLGIFGYLGSDRARRDSTGNWGLLDQLLSLEWVSKYVSNFGADPTRVTVGGWSSGAAALSAIMTTDRSKHLFRAAVLMSGGFADWAVFDMKTAEATYDGILQKTGCASSTGCLSKGPPCNCLLKIPSERLNDLELNFQWAPIVDNVVLHSTPPEAFKLGKVHAIPILMGSALEDVFPILPENATDKDFKAWLEQFVPAKDVDRAYNLYLAPGHRPKIDWIHANFSSPHWAAQRAKSDRLQTCLARRVSRHWPTTAWQYLWHTRFWGEDTTGFGTGICHSSDQHFLFQKTMPASWAPAAHDVQQAVAAFVLDGSPGKNWPVGGRDGMVFHESGAMLEGIRPEQCDFWDGIDGA